MAVQIDVGTFSTRLKKLYDSWQVRCHGRQHAGLRSTLRMYAVCSNHQFEVAAQGTTVLWDGRDAVMHRPFEEP
jgi:hypothetical protein